MNISNRFLQKYYPTRKLYVWALALIYIAPISLLAAQQKKPNLDVLTIKGLFELYKNNPQSITKTEISNEEKEKVIKEIKEELEKEDKNNKRGGSWADLQYLLNYDEEKGIPTLKLSYGTIDLPFDLFLQYSKNTECRNIIASMVEKQPQKVIEFTKKALGKLGELNAWLVLYPMLGELNKSQLDKEKVNEIFKEFTAKKYLKGMKISSSMHSSKVKGVASEIINKSPAIAKRFAQEAFDELKTLDVEKDKESIKAIWKILLEFKNFELIKQTKLALGDLNYHRLGLVPGTYPSYYRSTQLRKLLMNASFTAKENGIDEAQKLVNQAFQNNNQNSAHFWELLYLLIVDPEGPKKDSTQIAEKLVEKALKDGDQKFQKFEHFWELLYFLITDERGPKIALQKIDASNMTLEAVFYGAYKYPELLTEILKKDENKVKTIMKESSELLIKGGGNQVTRKKLHILTEKSKLFSKEKFNLDDLTLPILAGFYNKLLPYYHHDFGNDKYIGEYNYENNIDFITEVLTAQKGVVTKMIEKGLQGGGEAWKHLQELLDYDNGKGIPALDLSYATIDLSFDLLFKYSENKSRNNIIADMVKKQPKKGVHFIIEAVKHINDKKAWILLHAVFTGLPDVNLKDKFNDNDNIKALPVKHYLTAMVSKYMDKNNLLEITKKILEISAKTKQFAEEALQLLKSSGDNDKELHSHIWEILSKLVENHKDIKLELQQLPYKRLPWNGVFQTTLKKLLSKQNLQNAQQLANKAFTDNDNQNSKHFWSFLSFLITDQNGPEVNATQIKATKMTLDTALKGAHNAPSTLMKILKQDQNSAPAVAFVNEAFKLIDQNSKNNLWELLHCLIIDTKGPKIDATQLLVQKFDEKVVFDAFSSQGNKKDVIESLLRSHPNEAKELVKEILSNQNLFSKQGTEELLHWLIFDSNTNNQGAIVPLANVNITIEAAVAIFHYLQSQPNPKLSEILNNVFRNNLLQGEAEKKVNDILNDDTELRKPANIELLHWLIFDSNTNNQGAIVPLANINITPKRAIEILQSQPNQKLSEILNSAIKTQPSIGKGMLEIAINGQTGSSLDWSNANVNFDLLHLLMLDPNGPQLTIKGADLASLDLPAIERHISKPNALQLFKTILHDPNNIDTFNAFRYAIFPSNSNSNNTFDYQNVDWDRTKWGSIPALKELIKPIDLPEDIVVKKLQDDGFTHKAIVRDIVLTSSSNLLEKVLNIAFPNVTVTSTTPTPTITWPQSLSATNWDIVASLTDSQHGIIKAKEVIQKVVPGISSSHLNFAKDYDLSSVRWGDLDWEAFEGLAEQSNIASFSIQNYLTIAENVLPGLQFVNQEPEVSQIDWDQIKSYKVVNFLIEKEIIPKKILINAPRSLLKQRINNISRLSLAEADFWKNTQEEKSKYYWSFAPYAVGLVLASAITLYVFNKQTKKNKKKRGSHNKAAKVKTQHNKDNKQHQKIIGNPIHTNRN